MGKHYSSEFKRQVLNEYMNGESLVDLSHKHGVGRSTIYMWRCKYDVAGEGWLERSPPRTRHSFETKMRVVHAILQGRRCRDVAREYKVNPATIRNWMARFQEKGEDGLMEKLVPRKYAFEEKCSAVMRVLHGEPLGSVAREMDLPCETVSIWIAQYNGRGEDGLRDVEEPRRWTFEDKRMVVIAFLEEGKTATEAGNMIGASASQVSYWAKQFREKGEKGLLRGKVGRPSKTIKTDKD